MTDMLAGLPDVNMKRVDKTVLVCLFAAILAAVGIAGYGLLLVMPILLKLAADSVYFFVMLIVAVFLAIGLGELAMSWRTVYYKMQMIAKSLRKAVVKSDPIGAIDVAISRLETRLDTAREQKRKALAAQKLTETNLSNASQSQASEEALAKQAERQARPKGEVDNYLIKAQRWLDTVKTLTTVVANQRQRAERMVDAETICVRGIDNLKNQKTTLSMRLEAIKADAAQARAFKAFFGHSEEMEMFDLAVEEVEKQSAQCEAEVDQMLSEAEPAIQQAQLQASAAAEQARARLGMAPTPQLQAVPPVKDAVIVSEKTGVH